MSSGASMDETEQTDIRDTRQRTAHGQSDEYEAIPANVKLDQLFYHRHNLVIRILYDSCRRISNRQHIVDNKADAYLEGLRTRGLRVAAR